MLPIMLEDRGTWNLYLLAFILCLVLLYAILLKQTTHAFKPIVFLMSLSIFYILIGSPLKTFMEHSFSLHMIHMSILYFIVPPLFLLGIPKEMYERFVSNIKKPFFLSPIHALYLFSILLFFYHFPFIFNFISQHVIYFNAYETTLFVLAFIMWWPLASPIPKERLNPLEIRKYIFKCGLWITPACLFFILTSFIDAESSSFLTQMSAHLCIPPSESVDVSTVFFQSKTDQFMAGVCMFGLHKSSLMMTSRLDKYRSKLL